MKKFRYMFLIVSYLILSCENSGDDGNILVKARHKGEIIDQATVYIIKDTDLNPGIPFDQYDIVKRCDGSGEVSITELPPAKYYLYARGYSQKDKRYVEGGDGLTITPAYSHNTYKVTLELD